VLLGTECRCGANSAVSCRNDPIRIVKAIAELPAGKNQATSESTNATIFDGRGRVTGALAAPVVNPHAERNDWQAPLPSSKCGCVRNTAD
jgi:hypothetical protein